MERDKSKPVVAKLVKVLHLYGNFEFEETMRFVNRQSAEKFCKDMLGKKISNPMTGSSYTITSFTF